MYTTNIPQAAQSLGQTQSKINTNFNLISSQFATNHITFGLTNAGKHTFAEFINQNSPVTTVGEATIYANSVGGLSNLFFRPENQAMANMGNQYQLTKDIPAQFAKFGTNAQYQNPAGYVFNGGWTFLPGNLILMYGNVVSTANNNTGTTVPFPFLFPSGNPPFNIQISVYKASLVSLILNNAIPPTSGGFTYLINTSTNYTLYWTAIGN